MEGGGDVQRVQSFDGIPQLLPCTELRTWNVPREEASGGEGKRVYVCLSEILTCEVNDDLASPAISVIWKMGVGWGEHGNKTEHKDPVGRS